MEELRQIALDLLDAYYSAECSLIDESASYGVGAYLAELEREVTELRERIVSIT